MSQLKRRQADEDDDDIDETPLFSPSASPSSSDGDDIVEHVAGTSLERYLTSSNIGRSLLLKMGWREGSGLGIGGFGRVDPIPISEKRGADLTGIGKNSLDTRTIASSTANRRTMESERQLHESEAERGDRIALVKIKKAQREEVNQALKTYRCELCQKQYDRPSTYETHLNSYDHHHKKRFMEMKANQKGKDEAAGMVDKRREREKKREEKEMAKMARAAGIQLNLGERPSTNELASSATPSTIATSAQGGAAVSSGSGSGGWKKIVASSPIPSNSLSSHESTSVTPSTGWKSTLPSSSGWKTIGSSSSGGMQHQVTKARAEKPASLFQSFGFSTLDTSASIPSSSSVLPSIPAPPAPTPFAPPPPPPPSSPPHEDEVPPPPSLP